MTIGDQDEALQLLKQVGKLATEGHTQKEIARTLGFKTTFTLNNRLVKASQTTGKAVPPFKPEGAGKRGKKRVELVEVKRRGKGSSYGVNVPQEPLERAKMKPGARIRNSTGRSSFFSRPSPSSNLSTPTLHHLPEFPMWERNTKRSLPLRLNVPL